jgi:formylglycine-generating enzyme required for sulfatase activity
MKSSKEPAWNAPNRPRETVSWYEAVAFCRWLSNRLGYEVRLPIEAEWEKAARGDDARVYPWGNDYRAGYANIDETTANAGPSYLKQTTAVGLYPQGTSPYGVMDMAGNVWEWCLNEYENPDRTEPDGDAPRVLRGGSWFGAPVDARASGRDRGLPVVRGFSLGYRVMCSSPMPR